MCLQIDWLCKFAKTKFWHKMLKEFYYIFKINYFFSTIRNTVFLWINLINSYNGEKKKEKEIGVVLNFDPQK